VMYNALQNPNIKVFKMLSTDPNHTVQVDNRNYMPEFDPKPGRDYSIEVLGPFVEKTGNKPRLRRLGDYGKTKNGHSIILRLHYGKYKVLFGGDLNKNAEEFLLKQYANRTEFPEKGTPDSKAMIFEASKYFGADVMKVCHHGASDVTDEFMETVNPAAFVISSGDEEGHVHPRPDLLGRLGRFGKGESPVLLSTELQRSSREKEDQDNIKSLKKTIKAMVSNCSDESQLKELQKELDKQIGVLSKTNVDVYGSIYLKTDGERLITAFKYEEPSKTKKWFYFEYEIDNEGVLQIRK